MGYRLPNNSSNIKTKSSFAEYTRFEDDAKVRAATKRDFVAGLISAPKYKYPKLDKLINVADNGEFIQKKERETREMIAELRTAERSGRVGTAECQLSIDFYNHRLKKIMLVEAASRMRHASSSSEQQVAIREFMSLNRQLYGAMDRALFATMMATEQRRVEAFIPRNDRARAVKKSLEAYFIIHEYEGDEVALLDDETLDRLQQMITERYGAILSVVPKTDDTVVYDAGQCQAILHSALLAGGLTDKGWTVEIDAAKSNPATNVDTKKIYLPADTRRTAGQLRRLIIHEQEVHARRGQNGADSGVPLLHRGTARYADVEEGLGVLLECVVDGNLDNQSYHRARDRYLTAGIALGLDGNPKDGRATFGLVWRLLALRLARDGVIEMTGERDAKTLAMLHTENAFRGTNFAMPGIIYTKLKVYYEGLIKNAAFFTQHKDNLPAALNRALLGKYDHVDPVETQEIQTLLHERHY